MWGQNISDYPFLVSPTVNRDEIGIEFSTFFNSFSPTQLLVNSVVAEMICTAYH